MVIAFTAAWLLIAGATGHSLFGAAATTTEPTKTVPATPPGPPTATAAAQSFAPIVLDTVATPTFGRTKTPIPPP